jgi:hypothetical protein
MSFSFPYHVPITEYPESSRSISFGGGYQFASKPVGPDQLTFRLQFEVMFYITNSAGVAQRALLPQLNILTLEDFYKTHRLFGTFTYAHPTEGTVTCRFAKPFVLPAPEKGQLVVAQNYFDTNLGAVMRLSKVQPFDVTLISQP